MGDAPENGASKAAEETVDTTAKESVSEEESNGRGAEFWIMVSIGGSIGLCLLLFVVAMGAGTISGRWENVSALVAVIRDLMLIFLILEAILIGVALIAMLIQLSALINLLENEIQPIVENTQRATQTVKGTAQFMSKRVAAPVLRTYAALSGARVFFREIAAIRKNTQTKPGQNGVAKPEVIADESESNQQ